MAAAPTKSKASKTRAKNGQKAEGRCTPRAPVAAPPPPQAPLDFVLRIMRDDSKPDSLRAIMARAALPYLHKRGEAQERAEDEDTEEDPISDFELARRIAHILGLGEAEGMRELEDARASAKIAEEKARAAEARARELEQRTLAAEAMIARRNESRQGSHTSPFDSASSARGETTELEQLTIAHEKARAAEIRAREAEAHACEMQQRALAAEEVIAERRERRGRF